MSMANTRSAPPLDMLLSEEYWEEQSSKIDPNKAKDFEYPSAVGGGKQSENTTHFVVADKWGNIVSATQTLGNAFGSRIMPEGTGIWLNNSLAYCTFEPKGNPMDAHPGRRKLSGDCQSLGSDWNTGRAYHRSDCPTDGYEYNRLQHGRSAGNRSAPRELC